MFDEQRIAIHYSAERIVYMLAADFVRARSTALLQRAMRFLVGAGRWLSGILKALWILWQSLGPRWLRVLLVVAIGRVVGWHQAKLWLMPNLT